MMDDAIRERLRAIKSLMLLDKEEALRNQVDELSSTDVGGDERVQAVVEALRYGAHGEAVALIERVLAEDAPIATVEAGKEPARSTLREEVERLETRLTALENEEAELQRTIRHFATRYREELGPLVNRLLRLRKDRLEQSLYARRGSRRRRTVYNEAEAQFERFQHVLEETADAPTGTLSDQEQERLKATYRRASKLCHPDMVEASVEAEARRYFNELREAYQRNDLERVEAIADTLAESGFARRPDDAPATDRARLEARAERLRHKIEAVEATLEEMRASKAYETIASVDDLDAYFDALKQKLHLEVRRVQQGRGVRR